ncbi:protein kinase [Leptospira interrogans]|uniref:Protein kinase involved in LAO/AO amino acid transport n=1 Tax=Leptospira interrogans serovar Hardjo str. Norma TaxID=1279460 RepID=A0A0M4NCI9_LEPIR|nr:protein kinase [Leptospira interrogans]ALE41718.1 protein kinase involved in LAO/AO amino acid transport [Leptospira interrogans serovar Hardjo str. Norma]ALO02253.1 protein kinase [Leptospira interrogans serovar Hardjo-prajitno]EJP03431.1 putative LAO/AO transport system ATPase [Leptospira interrogans serovar Bulgarica str. Mallika]EKO98629.1 putative LAO/AO transport system ATPase [Leptospira interrogans str. Brem 329]EMN54336.1 putative LAO/AO transport system ATPase [Leptospira interrog
MKYRKEDLAELIEGARVGEKFPLAKLISGLERPDSFEFRKNLFEALDSLGLNGSHSLTVGFTGTPGAGKSSLLGELATQFLKSDNNETMAIVAIDPSSYISGGSLLGDRTRLSLPAREKRIYFRSQPSQLELGGVNPYTYHVIRLLRCFFRFVFIETVGIGQNEIEVSKLTDLSFLVLQPLGGDQIQFMKSGIMEVPDSFILNKCDEKTLANSSYHMLISTLEFLKDVMPDNRLPPVFKTSTKTKQGIQDLLDFICSANPIVDRSQETVLQLKKWIKNEFGNFGLKTIEDVSFPYSSNFETLEEIALQKIRKNLLL